MSPIQGIPLVSAAAWPLNSSFLPAGKLTANRGSCARFGKSGTDNNNQGEDRRRHAQQGRSVADQETHNLRVAGSIPAPATNLRASSRRALYTRRLPYNQSRRVFIELFFRPRLARVFVSTPHGLGFWLALNNQVRRWA